MNSIARKKLILLLIPKQLEVILEVSIFLELDHSQLDMLYTEDGLVPDIEDLISVSKRHRFLFQQLFVKFLNKLSDSKKFWK